MRTLAILFALILAAVFGYRVWNSDGGAGEWEALEREARDVERQADVGELAAPQQPATVKSNTTDAPAAERTTLEAQAWLTVRAIDRRTQEPIVGKGIYLDFGEWRVQAIDAYKSEEVPTGRVGVGVLSDKRGEARFRVPAGRELRAFVVLTDSMPPVDAPLEPQGDTHVAIEPLVRDEDRAVQLLVGKPQRTWHLQVVERESGRPVAGATVASEEDWKKLEAIAAASPGSETSFPVPPRFTLTDHNGRAAVTIDERDHEATSIHAEGYGPVYVPNSTRRETEADRFLVRLDRSATIRGQVLGLMSPERATASIVIRVSQLIQPPSDMYFGGGAEVRNVRLGPAGEFELVDLPPNLPLELKFATHEDEPATLQADILQLQPGEVYEHIWDLRKLSSVKGRVVDGTGAAVRGMPVRLVSGVDPTRYNSHMTPLQEVQSDVDGRFELDALIEGQYLVGIVTEMR